MRSVQVALLSQYAVLATLRLAFLLAVGHLLLACCVVTLGLPVSAARPGSWVVRAKATTSVTIFGGPGVPSSNRACSNVDVSRRASLGHVSPFDHVGR